MIFVLVKIDRLLVLHCCSDKRVRQAPGRAFSLFKNVSLVCICIYFEGGNHFQESVFKAECCSI